MRIGSGDGGGEREAIGGAIFEEEANQEGGGTDERRPKRWSRPVAAAADSLSVEEDHLSCIQHFRLIGRFRNTVILLPSFPNIVSCGPLHNANFSIFKREFLFIFGLLPE